MKRKRGDFSTGKILSCAAIFAGWLPWAQYAMAADSPVPVPDPPVKVAPLPKEKLYGLAQQFLQKVGKGLEKADLMLTGASKVELAEKLSGSEIPEGEPLLMHAVATNFKLDLKQDIYAIKRGGRLLVSFGEFCSAAELVIAVHPSEGRAEGWFIREEQRFFLDVNKHEVTIMGETQKIDPADALVEGSDLLVSSAMLEKWFGLDIKYDFSRLNMDIRTSQLLPMEARFLRSKTNSENSFNTGPPKQPFLEEPYRLATKPNIDVSLRTSSIRPGTGRDFSKTSSWNSLATGDFLYHTGEVYVGGNQNYALTTARATLKKEDDQGRLLGPLEATAYHIGDINALNIPLIDQGGQEQGIYVTNKPTGVTTDTETQIRGNAMPDWDVELYRGDTLLELQHIDTNGQYDFRNVTLFAGNNEFRLVFYGPQGEIREETRTILVDPDKFKQRKGYYSVSAGLQERQLYNVLAQDGPDTNKPHLAATYAYGFGRIGTAEIGARIRSDQGEERAFLQTGWGTYLWDTYINAYSGYDLQTLDNSMSLSARRNFGPQSLSVELVHAAEDFNPNNVENPSVVKYGMSFDLTGPLLVNEIGNIKKLAYNTVGNYSTGYDGSASYSLGSSLSGRYNFTNVFTGLEYQGVENPDGSNKDELIWTAGGRGFYKGGVWSTTAGYEVLPENRARGIIGQYTYRISPQLTSKTDLSYAFPTGLLDGAFALHWSTEKAVISPRVAANNQGKLEGTLNVRFGLTNEPYSGEYQMMGRTLTASGGVAARIFLDSNGDGFYNQGEELLQDTGIKVVQSFRKALSNERGIAFVPNIPVNILTDVIIDPLALPDATYMSLFDGLSIKPRPGVVSQIEFPIVVTGEMDGTAYLTSANGSKTPARDVILQLVAPDGRIEKTGQAAYDGYYSITGIRPGVYYLIADVKKMDANAYMPPQKLYFEPTGTTMYGYDPLLTRGYSIPYHFRGIEKRITSFKRARVEKPEDITGEEIHLHLGPYHSRLGLTFAWYKFKIRDIPWKEYFTLAKPLTEIKEDEDGKMFIDLQANQNFSMQEAPGACQTLIEMKFPCEVEVITHYTFDKTLPKAVEIPGSDYRQGPPLPKPVAVKEKSG
jgi:hypothetical protein